MSEHDVPPPEDGSHLVSSYTTGGPMTLYCDPSMCCIRCDKVLTLDSGCPHTPLGGVSMEATGNYGSSVHDNPCPSLWLILCDECLTEKMYGGAYVMEEQRPRVPSIFSALIRAETTKIQEETPK